MSSESFSASMLAGRLLFRGGGVIALDKPPGLPSTGRQLTDPFCAQYLLMAHCGHMVWAVHQLDADTSGVVLFAEQRGLVESVHERMRPPGGRKTYLAICHGVPAWDARLVEAPIGPVPGGGIGVDARGKPARSHFRVLARAGGFTAFEIELETGRTHQIRVHAAHEGYPLVGEERYGTTRSTLHPRQALHAWRVRLAPDAKHDRDFPDEFVAPLPADLTELAERIGLPAGTINLPLRR